MAVNVLGGPLEFDADVNLNQFTDQLNRMEAQLRSVTKTAKEQSSEIEGFARKASLAIGTYLSINQASNFITDIARVRGEFQQLEVAFTTMLQSKEKADKLMAQITEFAATTPFELQDVAGATKQLLAFGVGAEDILPTLRSLGDISAGIGAPLGEIAYLFGTIKTQGVAMTQDIRQFASRGIPIYEELSKILGVSTQEVGKFIEAGKIGFPEIQKVFQNLTAEGSKFGGLMAEQAKTLTGQISNFQDAYSQMLNELGKSSEGAFSVAIEGATFLVDHYQDVLDIIKVLVITYGSYKAAVITYNAVQAISTSLTKGYTIAEMLRYRAMLLSEGAMKLLNRTMLANPAVAIATGVAALVAALVIFNRTSSDAVEKQRMLNDIQEEAQKSIAGEKAKLEELLKVAQDDTKSKEDRLNAVKQLNAISPEYLGNITLETIKTKQSTDAINEYIKSLERKAVEEAAAGKKTKILNEITDRKFNIKNLKTSSLANNKEALDEATSFNEKEIKKLEGQLQEIDDIKEQILADLKPAPGGQTVQKSNKQLIDEAKSLASLAAVRKKIEDDYQASTDETQRDRLAKDLKYADDRKKALDIFGQAKKDATDFNKIQDKTNDLLNERKEILQAIADLQRDAKQSGLTKEQSELDKINEKYDQAIIKVGKFNEKVAEFNKKNKTNVQQVSIDDLNEARDVELHNQTLKQDVDAFKSSLEKQRDLFVQFEDFKKRVGVEKATEMFQDQTLGAASFVEFLKGKLEALKFKSTLGIGDPAENQAKITALSKAITDEEKKTEEELFKQRFADITRLFTETATVAQRKKVIEEQYERDIATLRKEFSGAEFEQQEANLKARKEAELQALQNMLITQSSLYQKLNQDIIGFSRDRIKQELVLLKAQLKKGTFTNADGKEQAISPEFAKQIEDAIKKWQDFLFETDEATKKLDKFAKNAESIRGAFDSLADGASGLNEQLANSLRLVSGLIGGILNASSAFKALKKATAEKDVVGQISAGAGIVGAALGVVSTVVGIFRKAKEERKKHEKELQDYYLMLFKGEFEINALYRERERAQVRLNQLRLAGLEQERKLLIEQKNAVKQNFATVLAELQKQTAKVPVTVQIGFITQTTLANQSLAGKSFDELEQMFIKGQLEGKAKDLFELLKKLKDEGEDIDQILADNKKAVQEIFTGTTSDSLLDSIVDGFKNGLHSASDFAGTFEDLMRGALINSLKFKYLEGPLKEFFEQFAAASESDSSLTDSEISNLQSQFNAIIANADQQFQQLQQIAGLNFNSASGSGNSLAGAIKGMTEQTAELLAGQMGGLRLTALDQLNIAKQSLTIHQAIETNTGLTVVRLQELLDKFTAYENGSKSIKIK